MKAIETQFFEQLQEAPVILESGDNTFFRYLDLFSSIVTECFYVIDVVAKQLCYISPDDLVLCGYSVEDAMRLGFDFYQKIIHPDDLPLWKMMYKLVLQKFDDFKEERDAVDYFSCTFRLQRKYSFLDHPLSQMVFHRMKPVWKNGELHYLICSVGNSTAKEAGNLRMYSNSGLTYEEYNVKTKRWKEKTIELLTERERAILMLAQQGNNDREIAKNLCKGYNSIRNQIKPLFSKLNVHSMQEAIEFACHHCILHNKRDEHLRLTEKPCKKSRILFTEDMKRHIQQHLEDGKSIRQAAKLENVEESAIRYWMRQGKLKVSK